MLESAKVKFPQLGSIGGGAAASSTSATPQAPAVQAKDLKADWETFIDNMGKSICEEQSPQRYVQLKSRGTKLRCGSCSPVSAFFLCRLLRIRSNLYELLTNVSTLSST
jgi:hypothetical protein